MRKEFFLGIVAVLAFMVLLWIFIAKPYQNYKAVLTNLQITEMYNSTALERVVAALEGRNITNATIFVNSTIVAQNCSLLRELDQKGYEIAAYVYKKDANGNLIQLATLPPAEQESIINSSKTALQACLGHSVDGFRSQRFSKNNYTNEIVKDLGFKWDGSFVTNQDPEANTIPYYSNKYGFYVVSIEGVNGYVLCDAALNASGKNAQQWRETIQSYFTMSQQQGTPFVTEFHASMLVGNQSWWSNFTEFLDWIKGQNATYVTTNQLITRCQPNVTCGE